MPKKRRKLNADHEKKIRKAQRDVELYLAKIYDISDDDIQAEYLSAFKIVISSYENMNQDYNLYGFNETSEDLINVYVTMLDEFKSNYEI